jgi:hypothetical protein
VKGGTDWGIGSDIDVRDEESRGPLATEPVRPQDRHRQFGWRVPVGLLVMIALLALAGHAQDLHQTSTHFVAPTPSPIPWVNAVVSPAPAGSAETGLASGSPSSLPAVAAQAIIDSFFWTAGKPNHFTIQVTNTSSAAIPLMPCPTYAMFISGTPANLATIRAMNCAEMGSTFAPGETLALDMFYTPSATDPLGFHIIEWQAISGFRATAQTTSVEIER